MLYPKQLPILVSAKTCLQRGGCWRVGGASGSKVDGWVRLVQTGSCACGLKASKGPLASARNLSIQRIRTIVLGSFSSVESPRLSHINTFKNTHRHGTAPTRSRLPTCLVSSSRSGLPILPLRTGNKLFSVFDDISMTTFDSAAVCY
jgi:hypothetical protein